MMDTGMYVTLFGILLLLIASFLVKRTEELHTHFFKIGFTIGIIGTIISIIEIIKMR